MSADVAHPLAIGGLTLAVVGLAVMAAIGLAAFLIACLRLLGDDADPGRPDLPSDRPGEDGEPRWWPEFERQLAAWAAERRRTPRSPRF
jgi:hypothetical protein